MDRAQLLMVGLPLLIFCSDIFHLFSPPLSKPAAPHHHHHHHHQPVSQPLIQQQHPSLEFPTQKSGGIGFGNTVTIDFCASCSYRGTAVTMKNMLESQFPGINIGDILKKLFEDGVVKREDLWITCKLWCADHAPEDVPLALNKTLNDLKLDYVDLYLMHCPVRMKKGSVEFKPENLEKSDIRSTWRAMEALCDAGKAKAIGVSNLQYTWVIRSIGTTAWPIEEFAVPACVVFILFATAVRETLYYSNHILDSGTMFQIQDA